jgi:hypothetical protein
MGIPGGCFALHCDWGNNLGIKRLATKEKLIEMLHFVGILHAKK